MGGINHKMIRHSITYGDKTIDFEIIRKDVKNINLSVRPDMSIFVSANEKVPLQDILDFVHGKAPWLIKNTHYFEDAQPEHISEKEYVSGETFKYLGRQYRLKVEESEEYEGVKFYQGYFYLYVKDKKNRVNKDKLMKAWFRSKAEATFLESLEKIYPIIQKYNINKPKIQIKTMKARWGSCLEDKGVIILNYELIKAPKLCIDYVVLHELVHFKYHNHDKQFYDFITSLMPDWKTRKEILDEEVIKDL